MNNLSYEIPDKIDAPEVDYLYVETSGIIGAGMGLFSAIVINENEIIAVFKGEILSAKEARMRAEKKLDGYFINLLNGTILDSNNTKCFAKYANDAEAFTELQFRNNAKITLDENDQVCLVALRDIKMGEEIFVGYGKKYWKHFVEGHAEVSNYIFH